MKKLLWILAAVVAFSLTGCASGQSQDSSASEDARADSEMVEGGQLSAEGGGSQASGNESTYLDVSAIGALPIAYGEELVSDDERICFYYGAESWDQGGGSDGIYCTDLDLGNPVQIFSEYLSVPLCIVDGKVYFEGGAGLGSADTITHEVSDIPTSGNGVRSVTPYSDGGDEGSAGTSFVVCTDDEQLLLGAFAGEDGEWADEVLGGLTEGVRYAKPADGVIYYTDPVYNLCALDVETGSITTIAQITNEWAFTVVGQDVYYLVDRTQTEDGYYDPEAYEVELMRSDAQGNEQSTGVVGQIGGLCTYGDYVFYTIGIAVLGEEGEAGIFGRPGCYDTVTGASAFIDRASYDGMDIALRGVAGGYLYFNGYTLDEYTGESVCRTYFDRIDGTGELISADELTASADVTQEATDWKEAWDQKTSEEAQQAYEESIANEQYGPGTSTLFLSASNDRSACYRLERRDGTVEFQVLLAPGESTKQTFPCGRYTLKTAEGEEWISDEEAFGPDGDYDISELFTFEDGESYEIGAGPTGNFHGSSQGGFTG